MGASDEDVVDSIIKEEEEAEQQQQMQEELENCGEEQENCGEEPENCEEEPENGEEESKKRPIDKDDTNEPDSKKQRAEDDDTDAELRLLITSKHGRVVIGKGGATIKKLRSDYGLKIIIPDCNGPERLVNINGKLGSICGMMSEL